MDMDLLQASISKGLLNEFILWDKLAEMGIDQEDRISIIDMMKTGKTTKQELSQILKNSKILGKKNLQKVTQLVRLYRANHLEKAYGGYYRAMANPEFNYLQTPQDLQKALRVKLERS